jgi:hypothetical protein
MIFFSRAALAEAFLPGDGHQFARTHPDGKLLNRRSPLHQLRLDNFPARQMRGATGASGYSKFLPS